MDRTAADRIPDDAVHYRLQIDDEEHHLELRPNSRLVAPGESKISSIPGVYANFTEQPWKTNVLTFACTSRERRKRRFIAINLPE